MPNWLRLKNSKPRDDGEERPTGPWYLQGNLRTEDRFQGTPTLAGSEVGFNAIYTFVEDKQENTADTPSYRVTKISPNHLIITDANQDTTRFPTSQQEEALWLASYEKSALGGGEISINNDQSASSSGKAKESTKWQNLKHLVRAKNTGTYSFHSSEGPKDLYKEGLGFKPLKHDTGKDLLTLFYVGDISDGSQSGALTSNDTPNGTYAEYTFESEGSLPDTYRVTRVDNIIAITGSRPLAFDIGSYLTAECNTTSGSRGGIFTITKDPSSKGHLTNFTANEAKATV
ncbi:uncharacterized protein L201_000108 [Kwoniella dendrophila CBS 6074]|uniref:Uncharacterized protein n=1 Tax=Kwoniella dendrophila CBS 6074 TaxID=1295534 RepID=A0AAX4JIE0_9TREE